MAPPICGNASGFWVPTPTAGDAKASGSRNTPSSKAHRGTSLTDYVRGDHGQGRWLPTPAARDYRHPNSKSYLERGGGKKGEQLPNVAGGPLNPTWVEWLMGLPLSHTAVPDSARSATPRSRRKQPPPSNS